MIKRLLFKGLPIAFVFIVNFLFSQEKGSSKLANELFNDGNFSLALSEYLELLEVAPEDIKLNYRVGVCYLNTNIDKASSIPYLEKSLSSENIDPNTFYLLGRAYSYAYRFPEAIKMFEQFKTTNKGTSENLKNVEKQIEYAYNAIEIMKFPLDVTFKNMGSAINSDKPDYYPFVPLDESFLVFNTKRDDGSNQLIDGSFNTEIYISNLKSGVFGAARKLDQNVNSLDGSEEIVGLSGNGNKMLFYFENEDHYGNLFIADYLDDRVQNLTELPKEINSKNHEISASINKNSSVIYFASDREGGYGGVDIYSSIKLPNGKWGPPQNLGPNVNTEYDEDFPNITADNKTLFFSSKGHTSMGGYDVFKASWNSVKRNWGDINNIGYPLNTPEDNTNFRASKTGRTGYISALREKGFGDLDVYSVTFNEVEPKYTVLKGYVKTSDSTQIKDVFISVLDKQTDELYGSYMTNPVTGRYVIILPPGQFNVLVEVPGFEVFTEDVEVLGENSFRSLIKKDYILRPL
ncbi:carboxypeptidase-like regulatory domain-containing protein [Vicingaceae bacterium]|nr:carboxypeptidase-like regulatory domain-containing protein [Vicingaceae bacterium]